MNSELVSILMERDSGIAEFRGALIVSVTSPKATFFANSARKTDACSERAIMQPSGDLSAQTSRSCDTTKSRVGSFTEIYRRSNGPSCRGGIPSRSDRNALVFSLSLFLSLSQSCFLFCAGSDIAWKSLLLLRSRARSPSSPSPFSHSFFALPTNSHSHRATRCCKFLPRSHKEKEIVYALNGESDICTEIFRVQP